MNRRYALIHGGGINVGPPTPATLLYDVVANNFTSRAPTLVARINHGAAYVARPSPAVIIVGGQSSGLLATVEIYNISTNSWRSAAPISSGRMSVAVVAWNDSYVFVMGGETLVDRRLAATRVNERYDPGTNTWESRAQLPAPRFHSRSVVLGRYIYLIGGSDADSTYRYDPALDTWAELSPMNTLRRQFGIAAYRNFIFVTGGSSGNGATFRLHSSCERYDVNTDRWTAIAEIQTGLNSHGVHMFGQRLHVFGGLTGSTTNTRTELGRYYDIEKNEWVFNTSVVANLPSGRHAFAVASFN